MVFHSHGFKILKITLIYAAATFGGSAHRLEDARAALCASSFLGEGSRNATFSLTVDTFVLKS